MITHAVGPVRHYTLGAILLDLDDPTRVRGVLDEPLLAPTDEERIGYVPNVVYTCGALLHGDLVFLPYACSDSCAVANTGALPGPAGLTQSGRPRAPERPWCRTSPRAGRR